MLGIQQEDVKKIKNNKIKILTFKKKVILMSPTL